MEENEDYAMFLTFSPFLGGKKGENEDYGMFLTLLF